MGILDSKGNVIELENKCANPDDGFELASEDIMTYLFGDGVVATWHTHPGETSTLSLGDYNSFQSYPYLKHYVIGKDGVSCYEVDDDGAVVICE